VHLCQSDGNDGGHLEVHDHEDLGRTTVTDVKARPNGERDKLGSGTVRGHERETRRQRVPDGAARSLQFGTG